MYDVLLCVAASGAQHPCMYHLSPAREGRQNFTYHASLDGGGNLHEAIHQKHAGLATNQGNLHRVMLDGPQDGSLPAANHALTSLIIASAGGWASLVSHKAHPGRKSWQ